MHPRKLNKLVAQVMPRFGNAGRLLDRVADAMLASADCADLPSELKSLVARDDALGQVYQAINAPALEAAYRRTARTGRKFTPDEIPAVTQLFTPNWVVEFLLQNTLGRLWTEMHPDTCLGKSWKWMCDAPRDSLPPRRAADLSICDPACGTMNFGLVALEMLREMYQEEISCAGRPDWPAEPSCRSSDEIEDSILRQNLSGFDIDPVAVDLARRSLEIKIGHRIGQHRLHVRDALFDNRIKGGFDVVLTNPPYLCARNLDPSVVARLKTRYPSAWRDLYASFMMRCLALARPGGRIGILSMHSFMFTAGFQAMREELLRSAGVEVVAHFGPGLFDIGNPGTLQTAAIVLQRKPSQNHSAVFFRLVDDRDKRAALARAIRSGNRIQIGQEDLASLPRSAWMYWISGPVRKAFSIFPKLGEISPPRQGLATTDNARFVRYWWEVEPTSASSVEPSNFSGRRDKWMPYAKGGGFRRWYEAPRHRVNWQGDGREIKAAIIHRYPYLDGQWQWVAKNSGWYGREGITYSYLTSGRFSARRLEPGTIFDVAGSSLFPELSQIAGMLGVLNSSVARRMLAAINPTVNFQVGDLRQLPVPDPLPSELSAQVTRAIAWTRELDQFDETRTDFVRPEPWKGRPRAQLQAGLRRLQRRVDQIVAELYGIEPEEQCTEETPCKDTCQDLAKRWISYALGFWLGRWGGSARGDFAVLCPLDPRLRRDLRRTIAASAGESAVTEIEAAVGGIEKFLAGDFLAWHNHLYRNRPIFWGFGGSAKRVAISANSGVRSIRAALKSVGETLPTWWRRWQDDGIAINLAPLAPWIADRKLQAHLAGLAQDMRQGRFDFSSTARAMKGKVNPGSYAGCASARPIRRVSAVPARAR